MRTWDTPEAIDSSMQGTDLLAVCPTLSAEVANAAIRGDAAEQTVGQRRLTELGTTAIQGLTGYGSDDLPSFEQTLFTVEDALVDEVASNPSLFKRATQEDVRIALFNRVALFNRLTNNDDTVPRLEVSGISVERDRERFTEALADVMMRPDSRANLIANVAAYADASNRRVRAALENGPQKYDFVIRGGGIHAANLVATLQECAPMARVLIIDDGEDGRELGGQFHKYGEVPVFVMNSRNRHAERIEDVYGIPKNGGNLNSFGLHAPLQLSHFTAADLATNVDVGHTAAVITAHSGADIIFADESEVAENPSFSSVTIPRYRFPITTPNRVVEAGGVGMPARPRAAASNELSVADVWRQYGRRFPSPRHAAAQYAGSMIMLVGCGDSAKVTAKLLVGQGPADAYRGWSASKGMPDRILWVADEFEQLSTKGDFQAGVRSMYASLAPFLPDREDSIALIEPIAGRFEGTDIDGRPLVRTDGRLVDYPRVDYIVRGTGLTDPGESNPVVRRLRSAVYIRDLFGSPYGRQRFDITNGSISVDRSISVGPTGFLGVRSDASVPENTAAIWAYAPATTMVGYRLAYENSRLRRR